MLLALPVWSQSQLRILDVLQFRTTTNADRLIMALWGDDPDGGPEMARRTLDVHLCNIRKKLRNHKLPWRLVNVWGGGYRLESMELA